MSDNNTSSPSIGFFGLLTVVFVTLKLCNVIAWSWWAVLAPLYMPTLVMVLIAVIIVAIGKL